MINLNEIAFIDTDGFDYNDGEYLVRFDTVMYCPDKKLISFAVTKIESTGNAAAPAAPAPSSAPAAPAAKAEEKPAKPWDGKLQLIDCDEETAACIMAIISDETDIPLDELQFRRIAAL